MKLVTFESSEDGKLRAGAVLDAEGDAVLLDLREASIETGIGSETDFLSVLAIIEGGSRAFDVARELELRRPAVACSSLSNVQLKAPLQPPTSIRDASLFELHLRQCYESTRRYKARRMKDPDAALASMTREDEEAVISALYRHPIYYKGNRFSVIGHEEDIIWPPYSHVMDFELEFGCYISKSGKDIPREHAHEYIFGYTIFNDFSARDTQALEMAGSLGPAKGKDFDTGNAMGPWLVTADELPDPYSLEMTVRVNGERWGGGNSSSMHWRFEDFIAHSSQSETLYPGEFFGSGTVGNGCGAEFMQYLNAGDIVELEIEGIGILRNRVLRQD